jgi:hypothetical protein
MEYDGVGGGWCKWSIKTWTLGFLAFIPFTLPLAPCLESLTMANADELPKSLFLDVELQATMLGRLGITAGDLFGAQVMQVPQLTHGDAKFARSAVEKFLNEKAPGMRFDELFANYANFCVYTGIMLKVVYPMILRKRYRQVVNNSGEHANDFTALKVPMGGPAWLGYLVDGDRRQFNRLTSLAESGALEAATDDVSSVACNYFF